MKLTFRLTRPAKKGGGDRYEKGKESEPGWMVIYVPQEISRQNDGTPSKTIEMDLELVD